MNNTTNKQDKKVSPMSVIVAILLLLLILLVLFFGLKLSTADTLPDGNNIVGNFETGGKREEDKTDDVVKNVGSITFAGYGSVTISEEKPDIELYNPAQNTAYFIFNVIDKTTGDIIARTDKVAPSQYVYVNAYSYYKEVGSYDVTVTIETFDEDGKPLNGMNEEMVINIIED